MAAMLADRPFVDYHPSARNHHQQQQQQQGLGVNRLATTYSPVSRTSFDSEIWTTSSVADRSPTVDEHDYGSVTPQAGLRGQAFDAESSSCSEYSPSLASIRQAVVLSPVTPETSTFSARPHHLTANHGLGVNLSAENNTYRLPTGHRQQPQPIRRHSSAASSSSLHSDTSAPEEDTAALQPDRPGRNQRMQSYLAPKMKIISPAPWDNDEEEADSSFGSETMSIHSTDKASRKVRTLRDPFGSSSTSERRPSTDSDTPSEKEKPKSKTNLLMRRNKTSDGQKSPGFAVPLPHAPPPLPRQLSISPEAASDLRHYKSSRTPDEVMENPINAQFSPQESVSTSASLPTSSSDSCFNVTSSTSMTSISSSTTRTDSLAATSPVQSRKIEPTSQPVSSQPLRLISLDAARAKERTNPFDLPASSPQDRKFSQDTDYSAPSSVQNVKPLRSKKSGFLKLFNRKEDNSLPPPPPSIPQGLRSAPPTIHTFAQAEQGPRSPHHPAPPSPALSVNLPVQHPRTSPAPSPRLAAQVSFLAPPIPDPQDRIRKNSEKGPAPSLSLRPVSMFSDNFAQDLLVPSSSSSSPAKDKSQRGYQRVSPASDHMSQSDTSPSLFDPAAAETPITPSFSPGFQSASNGSLAGMQERLSQAQQNWKNQLWELEQEVSRLSMEVDVIRSERDGLLANREAGRSCAACGCSGNHSEGSSVLSRPRVQRGEERTLFG